MLRQHLEESGVPAEEIERRLIESLASNADKGAPHDWNQGIEKEIQETILALELLERWNLETKH